MLRLRITVARTATSSEPAGLGVVDMLLLLGLGNALCPVVVSTINICEVLLGVDRGGAARSGAGSEASITGVVGFTAVGGVARGALYTGAGADAEEGGGINLSSGGGGGAGGMASGGGEVTSAPVTRFSPSFSTRSARLRASSTTNNDRAPITARIIAEAPEMSDLGRTTTGMILRPRNVSLGSRSVTV